MCANDIRERMGVRMRIGATRKSVTSSGAALRSGINGASARDTGARNIQCTGVYARGAAEAKMTNSVVQGKDFMELLNQYGLSRPNANTRKHYQYVWEVLYRYCKDKGRSGISVDDVDYALLCDIKRWIFATGKGEATRYKVESYMRTVYHEAERLKLVDRNDSPYFDYKIAPVPVGDIDVLDVEVLRRMLALNLDKHIGMARARDILMASFYLCGANLIDLYHISRPVAGEAVFVRHKVEHRTKRALHIRMEPELVDIVGRHRGSKTMFDFCEHQPYNNYQYKLNTLCRKLSEAVGSKVNMELIRRTWATIASELEVPDRVIDKSMGHVDSSVKDKYYERYDWGRTAMYNRKVIDFVWQGVVPNSIALC